MTRAEAAEAGEMANALDSIEATLTALSSTDPSELIDLDVFDTSGCGMGDTIKLPAGMIIELLKHAVALAAGRMDQIGK